MRMLRQHQAICHDATAMLKKENAKTFSLRHAISVAVSVSIAFMIQYIYSFGNEYWIVLSAFLVSQTTPGTPLKQGMAILLSMASAIIVSGFLLTYVETFDIVYLIASVIFMGNSFWIFMKRPQSSQTSFMSMVFSIIMLIAIFSPIHSLKAMTDRIFDMAIGALIVIICRMFIFPAKWDIEFRTGILPILRAVGELMQAIQTDHQLAQKNLQVQNALLNRYPSWIYETGFNRGLRSGFRFFLIHVERITEILFSLNDLISRLDPGLVRDLRASIETVMQKNQELITILCEYFQHERTPQTKSDFTSDMAEFETMLRQMVPVNIEGLAVSAHYLPATAFGRDMKDMRELLLQLVMALPINEATESGGKE